MPKKKIKVGDNIKSMNANWSFAGNTADNFDKHIKRSVPLYNLSHDIALKLSDFFLSEKTNIYDLGCSTGTFLNLISKRHSNRKHQFIGIDEIKKMCIIAKRKNYKSKNLKFINSKIEKIKFKNSSFITSFFTIQFVHPSKRQMIFNKIYRSLSWGGCFLLFE